MKSYLLHIIVSFVTLVIFLPAAWSADVDTYDPSEGHWVLVEAKCMIPGPANQTGGKIRIEGKYKQYQNYSASIWGSAGGCYPDSSYCLGPEDVPPSSS